MGVTDNWRYTETDLKNGYGNPFQSKEMQYAAVASVASNVSVSSVSSIVSSVSSIVSSVLLLQNPAESQEEV